MGAGVNTLDGPQPYDCGYLEVGAGHSVYYEQLGNPEGVPVVFLHGGPGSGCSARHRLAFSAALHRAVLFDQRGCGRSTPPGAIDANRTSDLIGDLERLRTHLGIRRWLVAGGSWGSALAVMYAACHPRAVRALVLRGIFLTGPGDLDWFFRRVAALEPEAHADLRDALPRNARADPLDYFHRRLVYSSAAAGRAAAMTWARYEARLAGGPPPEPDQAERLRLKYRIQAHYLQHRCFIGEQRLLRVARGLDGLPAIILQGRADRICRPENAWRLARALPGSELVWIDDAGHDPYHPAMQDAWRRALIRPAQARVGRV